MQSNFEEYRRKVIVANAADRKIEAKALLGDRNIETYSGHEHIEDIGDYAFFGCTNLKKVSIENENVHIGKKSFYGCNSLECINLGCEKNGELLALVNKHFEETWVFDLRGEEWYKKFDEKLIAFLRESNLSGFEGLWTFGEEDYEERKFDEDIFAVEKLIDKCNLVIMRLFYDSYLEDDVKKIYQDFLNCYKMDEGIKAVTCYHRDDSKIYKCIMENVLYTASERVEVLKLIEDVSPEIRSIVLNENKEADTDIFSDLLKGL